MPCFAPWIFLDNAGHAWALGVTSTGALTLSEVIPIPPQAVNSVPLQDTITENSIAVYVTWQGDGPYIQTTPASVPSIGSYIPLSASGRVFWLQTANGRLIGNWKTAAPDVDPVIGELFNTDLVNPSLNPPNLANAGLPTGEQGGWIPNYGQPGGIGTQSFPAQQSGVPYSQEPSDIGLPTPDTGTPYELGMGLNTAGCGHWFNCFDTTFATVQCQTSAIIRCPLCGYLVQIITPASLLYTEQYEHISS